MQDTTLPKTNIFAKTMSLPYFAEPVSCRLRFFVVLLHKISERSTKMRKILIITTIVMSAVLTSCNVTRVITNESQYLQKGDTSVTIQTKTVETYDASKKL